MVIVFDVRIEVAPGIACQLVLNSNALINEAHIGFNIPGATTTTFESAPGNNTSTVEVPITYGAPVDPNCGQPALKITKVLLPPQAPGTAFAWGSVVSYKITLKNASTTSISNIQLSGLAEGLGDYVSGGVGTPAFTAEIVGFTCPLCSGSVQAGQQVVAGYLNPKWMLGTNVVPSLDPNDEAIVLLDIRYTSPECDSYADVTKKPVLNFVRAKYFDPMLGGDITLQSAPAVALFEAPLPCNFKVTKQVNGGAVKIVFNQPVTYSVTYQNLNAQPVTIGTMIDALRIVETTYASPLTVHYDYTCSTTTGVTGFSVVGGVFPFTHPPGTVQVVHTSVPQQGVRIIQNTAPVLFPGNSSLTCAVSGQSLGTITVYYYVSNPAPFVNCATVGLTPSSGLLDSYLPNNLACVNVGMASNLAALAVTKTTRNLSPITMPDPQFPVLVDCQPGGPVTNLSLTPNAGALLVANIPPGSNCTITETPLPMVPPTPPYCQWVTSLIWDGVSHSNGSQFMNVQIVQPVPKSIEVHNDFVCNPPPPACAPPPSGMVAWWPLDETSGVIATDIIGAHNGTPHPGPIGGPIGSLTNGPATGTSANLTPPARVGGSLYFSVHKFVQVPNAPDLYFGAGDFTIDAWVYPAGISDPSVVQFIVDKVDLMDPSPTGGVGYRLFIVNGQLFFVLSDGSIRVILRVPITSGQWRHVAAVREGQTVKIYIDGTLVGSSPTDVNSIFNHADLLIGGSVYSPGILGYPPGTPTSGDIAIDELEIFNRALEPTEIKSIVNAGSAGKCRPTTTTTSTTSTTIATSTTTTSTTSTSTSTSTSTNRTVPSTTTTTTTSSTTTTTLNGVFERYFPRTISNPQQTLAYAVVNLSNSPANLVFKAYSNTGSLQASGQQTLAPGRQLAQLLGELLPRLGDAVGWLVMESNVPNVEGFFLQFDNDLTFMDGAAVSGTILHEFVIPRADGAEISLVNPGKSPATFTLEYVSEAGVVLASVGDAIPSLGRTVIPSRVLQLGAIRGYLRGRSTAGVAVLATYSTTGWLAALSAVDTAPTPSLQIDEAANPRTLYAPQYAAGGGFATALDLVNLEEVATTLTLQLIGDNGRQQGTAATLNLPARGSARITNPSVFGLETGGNLIQGYVRVQSSDGRFAGSVLFTDPAESTFGSMLAFVEATQTNTYFSQVAQNDQFYTGLAAINPNAQATTATITVYDTNGSVVGSGSREIPAGGRISRVLTELVGPLPALTKGYFRLTTTLPVAAFALFGTSNGEVLAAIPPQSPSGK